LKDYDLKLSNQGLQYLIAHLGQSIDSPTMKAKDQGMKDQGDLDQLPCRGGFGKKGFERPDKNHFHFQGSFPPDASIDNLKNGVVITPLKYYNSKPT
jgi:hypothetical protein